MTTLIVPQTFEGLITADFAAFDDSVEQLELTGETITVNANEWIEAREMINIGDTQRWFVTRYRFIDPFLSSVILRKTRTATMPDGRIDFNATIVSRREFEIQVGDTWHSLADFAAAAIKQSSALAHNSSNEAILHQLAQYGWDQNARLPMYLQHLGAGQEEFAHVAEAFARLGAADNTATVKSRSHGQKSEVLSSYRHADGVPVASMEISKANRSLSQTGTGFIGFLDGSWGTFLKVMSAHRTRIGLKHVLDDPNSTPEQKATAAAHETSIRNLFQVPVAARAFRNWGGTTEVKDVLDVNAPSTFYAQQVPCGRFSIKDGAEVIKMSVWTSSVKPLADLPTATLGELPEPDLTGF